MRHSLRTALVLAMGCSESFSPFSPADGGIDAQADTSGVGDARAQVCRALPADCDPIGLMAAGCGGSVCHGADNNVGHVDLESGDVFERLTTATYQYEGACLGEPMVDGNAAGETFFIRKLVGSQGSCGAQMPFGPVPNPELECYVAWIERETCLRSTPPYDAGPSDAGPSDAGPSDAGLPDASPTDAFNPRVDAGPGCGAFPGVGVDGDYGPDPILLTDEEAACLEVDTSGCVGCHTQGGRFALRVEGAPTPPPIEFPRTLEECRVPRTQLCADEAECFGFDQPDCSGCHVLNGVYYLRPWFSGPVPSEVPAVDPACYAPL